MKVLLILLAGPLLAISTAHAQCTTLCRPSVRYQTTMLTNVRYVPDVRLVPSFTRIRVVPSLTTWTVAEPAAELDQPAVVYAPVDRIRPRILVRHIRPLFRFRLFGCRTGCAIR